MLTLGPKRLAAGREDADIGCAPQDCGHQRSSGIDEVRAVVEHQHHPPAAQRSDEGLRCQPRVGFDADGSGNCRKNQVWVRN